MSQGNREDWRDLTVAATVQLPAGGGQGVLVPGGVVLSGAHCVEHDLSGRMALEEHLLEQVKPKRRALFRLNVCAVEPVADIAVLEAPDIQVLTDDARAFEDFSENTPAVPLRFEDPEHGARVHVLTHEGSWIEGRADWYGGACIWLVTKQKIEGGTSGGPVVDDRGYLVGLVSHSSEEGGAEEGMFDGRMPMPALALPRWLVRRIEAAQLAEERDWPTRCPRCGGEMPELPVIPALSRADNKTLVCSECGLEEAFEPRDPARGNLTVAGKKHWPT